MKRPFLKVGVEEPISLCNGCWLWMEMVLKRRLTSRVCWRCWLYLRPVNFSGPLSSHYHPFTFFSSSCSLLSNVIQTLLFGICLLFYHTLCCRSFLPNALYIFSALTFLYITGVQIHRNYSESAIRSLCFTLVVWGLLSNVDDVLRPFERALYRKIVAFIAHFKSNCLSYKIRPPFDPESPL